MSSYTEAGRCAACGKAGLSITGFQQHVRQSTNTLCAELFNTALKREASANHKPTAVPEAQGQQHHAGSFESDWLPDDTDLVNAVSFAGDAFGTPEDYADDDFGQNRDNSVNEVERNKDLGDSEEDDDDAAAIAELQRGWEPPIVEGTEDENMELDEEEADEPMQQDAYNSDGYFSHPMSSTQRREAELRAGTETPYVEKYSERYPEHKAGAIQKHVQADADLRDSPAQDNVYAPFVSKLDWEIARWAKLRGPGSTAFSELLAVEGVRDALGLSFGTTQELNATIDKHLPGRPKFHRREAIVQGEAHEFYARDIIECITALWGEPDFANELVFEPERHYVDEDQTIRLFHDMHTGKWWWSKQKELDENLKRPGVTIIPIIIASDKTQLTVFGNKVAYPVYLTIGNLPSHIRRKPSRQGQVLLAYLPASKLDHISNKSARRRALANLFHGCLGYVLNPLVNAGKEGIDLTSGDGAVRRCHPIVAAFVGDYPEQLLATLIKTGKCPTCPVDRDKGGDRDSALPPRNLAPILAALGSIEQGATAFTKACADVDIRPIQQPFWKHLPFFNIYETIVPDILHQLQQGVLKHVIRWLRTAYGDAEIDARCRRLPPNHNIRLFLKGISSLSRVTGKEHDQISRILLGLIISLRLPNSMSNVRLLRAVRAILDFIQLAQYPLHSYDTLDLLEDALDRFHANKDIFIDLGIRAHFNFPKLHSMCHYRLYIELFGTTDNYNTAYTERLHIDMAKEAYRATNCKDEYAQMTAWLDRRERIFKHEKLIKRRIEWTHTQSRPAGSLPSSSSTPRRQPTLVHPRTQLMAKHPSISSVSLSGLHEHYGAMNFEAALARAVVRIQNPQHSRAQVENAARHLFIPFDKVPVYHRIKFFSTDPYSLNSTESVVDSIHVQPARRDKLGEEVPARFDTALINLEDEVHAGVVGSTVGRVRCVFTLPSSAISRWFTSRGVSPPSVHFAYVDWFTDFRDQPERNHGLFKISYLRRNGEQLSSEVPVSDIWQSVHLFPAFGPIADRSWLSTNVLDLASEFYVNPFTTRFAFSTIY